MSIGSLVSGIIGAVHSRNDELSGREEQRKNREMQEDFANHGIEMRVNDAKRAGIHPLFALNANLPSYSPSIPVQSDTSFARDLGNAIDGFIDRDRRAKAEENAQELHDAQVDVLKSEAHRNDAVAQQAQMSMLARAAQTANVTQDKTSKLGTFEMETPLNFPKGKTKAQDMEDFYGDVASEIEMVPLYVKHKGEQIAEEYRDFLDRLIGGGLQWLKWKGGAR